MGHISFKKLVDYRVENKKKKSEEEEMATEKNINSKKNEEWVWVEGFKGTDFNMMCRNYQYEMNKQHDMPEGAEIIDCESGFHLCLTMKHVDSYYGVGCGNRYFRVKALVRKSDLDEYDMNSRGGGSLFPRFKYGPVNGGIMIDDSRNKLAAKSIIFTEELTRDEILTGIGVDTSEWTEEQKDRALIESVLNIESEIRKEKEKKEMAERLEQLVELGYSRPFAKHVIYTLGRFDAAFAAGSQSDLSMDMKCLMILHEED